ncbi:MAG TPA: DNA-formamidopyrimidine glycosylase family protein [Longimicrobiales bacterium]|nr:DNA-formamidopyrimidine glycosylase family protein [Longimicrobiales bacterium]
MPELPDIQVYLDRLASLLRGHALEHARVTNPFVLRTVTPPLAALHGRAVTDVSRIGKRIVLHFDGDVYLVIHLMIAGRLRWRTPDKPMKGKLVLAAFTFPEGVLYLTEAGTKRRAMLHVVDGAAGLDAFDRGGIDPMTATLDEFGKRLRAESHTLKRSLTDPRIFSGIGNAYSDEILHRARLSPLALSRSLADDDVATLHTAIRATLAEWTERLGAEAGPGLPEKVTAFHPQMAVHGRYGMPCPDCGAPVQRIRYADNETNYCARCQTGGRILADRAMSRLLGDDWPRSIDDVE